MILFKCLHLCERPEFDVLVDSACLICMISTLISSFLIVDQIKFIQVCNVFFTTAEQELAKLQRQYRIIEGDRRAYSEETQNHIRKQM